MFEARLVQGGLLKKIVESIKDLVTDGNMDCSETGMQMQAMDSSHVALVLLTMRADGFDHYRCDKNISLGLNLTSLAKILKCADNSDTITMKAKPDSDTINLMFENEGQDKLSDFEVRLMDIDADHLGIPETEYSCVVKMPASEFQKVCRDLNVLGETCVISVNKEGVKFSVSGDLGKGNITRKHSTTADNDKAHTVIDMEEPVSLTFSLRYLNFFTKATPLAEMVTISMSKGTPLMVEYPIGELGSVRFYLAPKIDEEEDEEDDE